MLVENVAATTMVATASAVASIALRTGTAVRPRPDWSACCTPIAAETESPLSRTSRDGHVRRSAADWVPRRLMASRALAVPPARIANRMSTAAPTPSTVQSAATPGCGSGRRTDDPGAGRRPADHRAGPGPAWLGTLGRTAERRARRRRAAPGQPARRQPGVRRRTGGDVRRAGRATVRPGVDRAHRRTRRADRRRAAGRAVRPGAGTGRCAGGRRHTGRGGAQLSRGGRRDRGAAGARQPRHRRTVRARSGPTVHRGRSAARRRVRATVHCGLGAGVAARERSAAAVSGTASARA